MMNNHRKWYALGFDCKRNRLDSMAASMRKRNLTHGTGCKSTARAIAKRIEGAK